MTDRTFEPMTADDVVEAQQAWTKCVTEQDVEGLLRLYDFGTADQPLLFKPTLASDIRVNEKGARAYFVGGDPDYPQDNGFLKNGWVSIDFRSAAGPQEEPGGISYRDMGQYTFTNGSGDEAEADYTFAYHKIDGRVRISLHHSSLTWFPAT